MTDIGILEFIEWRKKVSKAKNIRDWKLTCKDFRDKYNLSVRYKDHEIIKMLTEDVTIEEFVRLFIEKESNPCDDICTNCGNLQSECNCLGQ